MRDHFRRIIQDSRVVNDYDVLTQVEQPFLCGITKPCLYILPVHRGGALPEFMVAVDPLNVEDEVTVYSRHATPYKLPRMTFHEQAYDRQIAAEVEVGSGIVISGEEPELKLTAEYIMNKPVNGDAQRVLSEIIQQDAQLNRVPRSFDPFDL